MVSSSVKIIPLGGLGEIGLNMLYVEAQDAAIIVDAGLMFPQENILGIEYLIPDYRILVENREKIKGFFLTHGHEDHIGALPFILPEVPAPVYASLFTLALVKQRLRARAKATSQVKLNHLAVGKTVRIGPFQLSFLPTSHSTLGARALVINTPAGVILHSGDFKIDSSSHEESRFDPQVYADLGKQGVTLLMADSTNAHHHGTSPREENVEKNLRTIIKKARGRVVIGVFSSHIQRIQQILDAAVACKKKVILSGRSLETHVAIARDLGLLKIPADCLLDERGQHRANDLVIISTGSQGESRAVLPRLARDEHPHLEVSKGDTVILSARIIPGNERPIYQMINAFSRLGAEVHYGEFTDVQASGHAYSDEQQNLISLVKPKFFIPVHGEYRHLVRHAQLASQMGLAEKSIALAENGDCLHLTADSLKKKDKVETGRLCVYGRHTESSTSVSLKERKRLARGGVVTAVLGKENGDGIPEILAIKAKGLSQELTDEFLLQEIRNFLLQFRKHESGHRQLDFVERGIRRYCKDVIGRKPVVLLVNLS